MPASAPPVELERRRRLVNLGFAELARRSGVAYMRLYRYFTGGSPLTEDEESNVRAVLDAAEASA